MRRSVNNDVRSHFLNLLIAEKLISNSDDATGNVQTVRNKTNKFGKRLSSHSFNADDDIFVFIVKFLDQHTPNLEDHLCVQ